MNAGPREDEARQVHAALTAWFLMTEARSYARLQENLRYNFHDQTLLEQALTHASWRNENRASGRSDNERLEWLGDAVLELVVTRLLFDLFPTLSEGELTDRRKPLVDEPCLADVGAKLGLAEDDVLLLGIGERENDGGRQKRIADACEALVAAVYLDSRDFDRTFEVVRKMFEPLILAGQSQS